MTTFRQYLDNRLQPKNFLPLLTYILIFLSTLYCLSHIIDSKGSINIKPSLEDINLLNRLDSAHFSKKALLFLEEKYQIHQLEPYRKNLAELIDSLGKENFVQYITHTGIRKKSFFWLSGDAAIIEVIFWSLFGTLCSFLYYFVENKKKGTVDQREFPSYIAKIFYTPFVSIIIYFSPNLFTTDNSFSLFFGYWTIVIAFVLGFFSGRAIELLDRLKNFLFPYNTAQQGGETTTAQQEIPEEVFIEAIDEKSHEWEDQYGPFESIGLGKKRIADQKTETFCLQFDVRKKEDQADPDRIIPPYIEYTARNGKLYSLPTDVNEAGDTTQNYCYRAGNALVTGQNLTTKLLGISCSRANSQETGTIGLRVKSTDPLDARIYLLSCYHVLCPQEIQNGQCNFKNTSNTDAYAVISPSLQDQAGRPLTLGFVREGTLGNNLDIALAEITSASLLDNRIYGTVLQPSRMLLVTSAHARQDYEIRLTGRTSGLQKGYIDSAYTQLTLKYPTGTDDSSIVVEFRGVIKTCKISDPGDSGAAVYDRAGNIIGIVFASNSTFSYVLPLYQVFKKLKLTFA